MQKEGRQWLIALEAQTGKTKRECDLAPEFENPMGNGPRGIPAIAGDLVFAFTGEGVLAAVKFADSTPVWSHNVVKDLKGKIAEYGMACSPIVVSDQVIVTVGAPQATVVAFDAKSGRRRVRAACSATNGKPRFCSTAICTAWTTSAGPDRSRI